MIPDNVICNFYVICFISSHTCNKYARKCCQHIVAQVIQVGAHLEFIQSGKKRSFIFNHANLPRLCLIADGEIRKEQSYKKRRAS